MDQLYLQINVPSKISGFFIHSPLTRGYKNGAFLVIHIDNILYVILESPVKADTRP